MKTLFLTILTLVIFIQMAGAWEKKLVPTAAQALAEKRKITLTVYIPTSIGTQVVSAKFKEMELCQKVAHKLVEDTKIPIIVECREMTK